MNNHAIKSGVIVGIVGIVLMLLFYLIDPGMLVSGWVGFGMLAVYIVAVCYFGIQHRKEIGGYMTFGKAWVYSMQAFVLVAIFTVLFNLLLYTVIDPELPAILVEQMVENQADTLEKFGMPADQIDEQLSVIKEKAEEGYTVMGQLKGFFISLIVYAIAALITGAVIKKKEPEFEG